MPIKYKIVKQCQPGIKGGGEGKYYARVFGRQKKSLSEICKIISQRSTFSAADVVGVVTAFTELIPELLANGQTLELDRMGIFSVSLKSSGENTAEEVTKKSITGVQINFRPGVAMKEAMRIIEFEKAKG